MHLYLIKQSTKKKQRKGACMHIYFLCNYIVVRLRFYITKTTKYAAKRKHKDKIGMSSELVNNGNREFVSY